MKVDNLKINHITRPMGYWYRTLTASWKVKEALGKVTGDKKVEVEGAVEKAASKVKEVAEDVKDAVEGAVEGVKNSVKQDEE